MALDVKRDMAKDGNEILTVIKDEKEYRLNSGYRPAAEAEKFAEQFAKLPEESVLLVFGYGNGLFAKAIMDVCDKVAKVIFYEPCSAILEKGNTEKNIFDFLKKSSGVLVADKAMKDGRQGIYTLAEFPRVLQDFIFYHNRKKVYFSSLPKYEEIFQKEYETYWHTIEYHMQQLQANQETAKAIGHIAVENNIRMLTYIPDSYCSDSFIGLFPEDMPAVIVSAGPSLEKNVKELKMAKGHALIVCVDTAVGYLLKENIIPDFLVSLDPRKELALFEDSRISEIPMVGVADMSIKVLERTKSKRLILTSAENPYIQKLYADAGHKISRLESGGSVATMAYSFCRYIGFRTIILAGQDLALTGDQMYVGKQKIEMEQFGRERLEVEDIYGNPIYTTRDYYYYLKWFEQAVERHKDIQVIDATEGGAKIKGTSIMPLQKAIETYGTDSCDIVERINSVKPAFGGKKREICIRKLQNDQKQYGALIDSLKQGETYAVQGLQCAKKKAWLLSPEALTLSKKITDICEKLEKADSYFLIMREIDASDLDHYLKLCAVRTDGINAEWFGLMQEYFECMIRAAKSVSDIYGTVSFDK